MKSISAIVMVMVITAGAPTAFASEEILIEGQRTFPHASEGVKALDACTESFVNAILPNRGLRIRLINQVPGLDQAFNPHSLAKQSELLDIELVARMKSTGALLATSQCTVGKNANVVAMKTNMSDQTKLSALKPNDFTLIAKMG